MHQQLWGYKVEEKLYVGLREQKRLNTAGLEERNFADNQNVPLECYIYVCVSVTPFCTVR
jgi:hypothetical protein